MTDLLGKTINGYQLIEVIHQGQNTVYKGFQPSANRYVAVKTLRQSLASDPGFAQEFNQDMQRVARLEHPNILPVFDFGQLDDVLYIVTRYVEGGTLQDRLPPAFSGQQAQAMMRSLAGAVDYLHGQRVVHGNLKPSNILIDEQGQPLLADLGFSQGVDVSGQENVYLSPEQAQGAFADERTDVYALGILLYEMAIGQPPARGGAPSPRSVRPDLPVEVEQVILKATAQNPDQRYQTAGELSRALDMALASSVQAAPQPVPAPVPAAATAQSQPGQSRSWIFILAAGLVFLCILALVLGGVFAYSQSGTQDDPGFFLLPVFLAPGATPTTEQPDTEPTPEVIPTVVITVVPPTQEPIVVTATPEEQPIPEPTEEPAPPNPEPTEEPAG